MDLHQKFTLCTLCLDPESNLLDVFEYNERGFKLSVVIQELLQLKVTKQGRIPWMSCTKCIGKLKDFVSFRNNATKSINILKCLLFDKKKHRSDTWENASRIALEGDNGHFDDPRENVSSGNLVEPVKDDPDSLDSHGVEPQIAVEEDDGHPDEPVENISHGNLVVSVKNEPDNIDSHGVESETADEGDDSYRDEPRENVSPGNLVESVKDEPDSPDTDVVESEIALEEDNGRFDEPEENVSHENLLECVTDNPDSLDSDGVESELRKMKVHITENESGPLREVFCVQGDVHAGGTWSNMEAGEIESEQVPNKMEEIDFGGQTEHFLPNSCAESIEDEHSEPADVESQARDVFEEPLPKEEDSLISDGNCSDGEVHCSDVHSCEYVVHVKHEDVEHEIRSPQDRLFSSEETRSLEVQRSDFRGSASEVTMNGEELMVQEDLRLHLSSSSSDEGSDVEGCALSIAGPEAEVTGVNCMDEASFPVDGGIERKGESEETLIKEEGLIRVKGTGHGRSARKQHCAMVPVATDFHLKQRKLRSNSRNENYGPNEGIKSTPCSTSGKPFGERNEKHTRGEEETRRESKHGNGTRAGNISIGSSVADEKSEGQDFMCDACGRVFRSKDLIERHVKVPCGRELIECGIQSKKLHNRNDCKRHRSPQCGSDVSRRGVKRGVAFDLSGKSEGKRQIKKRIPATCLVCNKTFTQRSHLKVHIKTVHLKERNFSCEICGKAFGLKVTLQSHMAYHSGVKPYTCGHCEMGFTQSGHLKRHIRAVHEMEKPHTCGECGKAFSFNQDLKRHMLVHTGERPHTCDICSRSFSHKHHLRFHMLIHTGEKPHTCTLCSKTFRQNVHLKRHMATHARKVPH